MLCNLQMLECIWETNLESVKTDIILLWCQLKIKYIFYVNKYFYVIKLLHSGRDPLRKTLQAPGQQFWCYCFTAQRTKLFNQI